MSCIAIERLAAAASGQDAEAAAHAAACVRCSALLGEQRDVIAVASSLHAPVLAHARRAEMAAELAARLDDGAAWRGAAAIDEEVASRRAWKSYAVAAVLAAAAAIALIAMSRGDAPEQVTRAPAPLIAPPVPPVAPVASSVIEVSPPIAHVEPAPVALPHRASPHVVAPVPAPAPARVPAPAPGPNPAPHVDPAANSMAAFRAGWQALRAGRNAEAIAAFDRATDPVVVEDATFWAAIAADRAGDRVDSKRRLHDFLEQYPQSPHVDAARAALK